MSKLYDRAAEAAGWYANLLTTYGPPGGLSYTDDHVAFIRDTLVAGIGHIDTAHLYAGGDSETAIGAAKLEAIVGTKGGYAPGEGRPDPVPC